MIKAEFSENGTQVQLALSAARPGTAAQRTQYGGRSVQYYGLEEDRWAYFAKLINIVAYEIVANRELFSEQDWQRLGPYIHVPVDWNVTDHLTQIYPASLLSASLRA